jgi:hypothetical protein
MEELGLEGRHCSLQVGIRLSKEFLAFLLSLKSALLLTPLRADIGKSLYLPHREKKNKREKGRC